MDDLDIFYQKDLYPIRVTDYVPYASLPFVIYSPLSHNLAGVNEEKDISRLRDELKAHGRFSEADLQLLLDEKEKPTPNYVSDPNDVYALTILPNNICNFSCSYCYAAKGHGRDELDDETLCAVLDYFIDARRTNRRHLYISFGGGGEPLLSWNKVRTVLQYAEKLANSQDIIIHYSFASNGSIINDEIIEAILKYNIKTNISFDILEDIQNIQRKHYEKVCKTLDILLERNILPTINSVITPLNVARQEDMVKEISYRFPKLKRLSFDYVVDANLCDTPDELQAFYDTYTEYFFRARETGKQLGINVSSIKHHNLEQIKMRACAGGFDLTPQGTLSMCFFVSSPKEAFYNDFIYGYVKDGKLVFDAKKFQELVDVSANKQEKCHQCFLKWHCAGGCLYHAKSYSKEMLEIMCHFQRKFSLVALLNEMTGQNILAYGNTESK
jgi:radical SAM additional 4Fe4S-binding domain